MYTVRLAAALLPSMVETCVFISSSPSTRSFLMTRLRRRGPRDHDDDGRGPQNRNRRFVTAVLAGERPLNEARANAQGDRRYAYSTAAEGPDVTIAVIGERAFTADSLAGYALRAAGPIRHDRRTQTSRPSVGKKDRWSPRDLAEGKGKERRARRGCRASSIAFPNSVRGGPGWRLGGGSRRATWGASTVPQVRGDRCGRLFRADRQGISLRAGESASTTRGRGRLKAAAMTQSRARWR